MTSNNEADRLLEKFKYVKDNNLTPSLELLKSFQEAYTFRSDIFYDYSYLKLLKDIISYKKPNTLLDPFCRSGNLLIQLPDNIQCTGITEYEIEADIAQYFNPKSKIIKNDFYNIEFDKSFDCIVASQMTIGLRPSDYIKFINKFLPALSKNGSLLLTIPSTFLTAPIYQNVREVIIKDFCLEFVSELPINGYINIEMNLLSIKNSKQNERVLLNKIKGYSNNTLIKDFNNNTGEFWVNIRDLKLRWDRNFHNPAFVLFENELSKKDTKELQELSDEIINGIVIPAEHRKDSGEILVVNPGNIKSNDLSLNDRQYYCDRDVLNRIRHFQRSILKPGDILISLIGPKIKTYIYKDTDPLAIANQNIAIVRAKDNKYIKAFLESDTGINTFLLQVKRRIRGATIQKLTISDLKNIRIPIISSDNLNELIPENNKSLKITEANIVKVIEDKLIEKGWSVKKELKVNGNILDLGLCIEDIPVGLVEIKSYMPNFNIDEIKNQIIKLISRSDLKIAYFFFDKQLYEIVENKLFPIEDFPILNEDLKNKILTNKLLRDSELIDYKSPPEMSNQFLYELLAKILSNTEEIKEIGSRAEEKLDILINMISNLSNEFKSIKNSPFEVEEKLSLLNKELDSKIKEIISQNKEYTDNYIAVVQSWLSHDWDKLEELSKLFLPSAEFLFSRITSSTFVDLSPFIIQYCRALENEILNKVFKKYLDNLILRNVEIETEFAWDFGKHENGNYNCDNTFKLAKYIKDCLKKDRSYWFFELGNMEVNLRYLTGRTSLRSPLLIDMKEFLLSYFEENILELEFLDNLKRITKEYRNKAAHSDLITLIEAKSGRKEIQDLLKQFLGYYKEQ